MITDYIVVAGGSRDEIMAKVKSFILDGYEPIGGVSACVSQGNYMRYCQAMIKREEKTSL